MDATTKTQIQENLQRLVRRGVEPLPENASFRRRNRPPVEQQKLTNPHGSQSWEPCFPKRFTS